MNKKQAIAYAQIALDYMKHQNNINIITLGVEIKQAFKMYPKKIAIIMAKNMEKTEKEIINRRNSKKDEW